MFDRDKLGEFIDIEKEKDMNKKNICDNEFTGKDKKYGINFCDESVLEKLKNTPYRQIYHEDRKGALSWRTSDTEESIPVYRFRAEILKDFENFLMRSTKAIGLIRYVVLKDECSIPDIEVWLETRAPLEFIRNELRKVEDGHVMVQTLALEQDYTGERDYTL